MIPTFSAQCEPEYPALMLEEDFRRGFVVSGDDSWGAEPQPPLNNMGGTGSFNDGTELLRLQYSRGGLHYVRVPSPLCSASSRAAFVDQVSFTLSVNSVLNHQPLSPFGRVDSILNSPDMLAQRLSESLRFVFGFVVGEKLPKGRNFYQHSFALGERCKFGAVSFGGNDNGGSSAATVNIQVTGQGCLVAPLGWERRLYDYLIALGGHLSRCDLAHDCYDGFYTPEKAKLDWELGKFSLTNRVPKIQLYGGSWWNPRESDGKTISIGRRESGKITRVYEKGLEQLGKIASKELTPDHPLYSLKRWVRIETEWHRTDRILPLEMLLEPGKYLAGAHPAAIGWISEVQEKVRTIKAKVKATIERVEQNLLRQCAKSLNLLRELGRFDAFIERAVRRGFPTWVADLDLASATVAAPQAG